MWPKGTIWEFFHSFREGLGDLFKGVGSGFLNVAWSIMILLKKILATGTEALKCPNFFFFLFPEAELRRRRRRRKMKNEEEEEEN